jgi:hypothetical protein
LRAIRKLSLRKKARLIGAVRFGRRFASIRLQRQSTVPIPIDKSVGRRGYDGFRDPGPFPAACMVELNDAGVDAPLFLFFSAFGFFFSRLLRI